MTNSSFGCRRERSRLLAYVDGSLDVTSAESFETHLDECAACRSALEFDQLVEEVLHRDAGTDFDAGFESRICARVAHAIDAKASRSPVAASRGRWLLAAGIAAGIATTYGLWELAKHAGKAVDREVVIVPPQPSIDMGSNGPGVESPPAVAVDEPASPTSANDRVLDPAEIAQLNRARGLLRDALRIAARSTDFAARFASEIEPLVAERWPIDAMVRGAIDDADPEIARAAIEGVRALAITDAIPAIRRAARRAELSGSALVALGDLGDTASFGRLSQALSEPRLAEFACSALAKLGTPEAAAALSRALDDPARFGTAFDALITMGDRGIAELLVRADRGNIAVSDRLAGQNLPTDRQLETLLTTHADPNVLVAAAHYASRRGAGALRGLMVLLSAAEHQSLAIESLVAIGGRPALEALLAGIHRHTIEVDAASEGVRRLLAGLLDANSAVLALARGETKSELLSALTTASDAIPSPAEEEARLAALRTIASDAEIELRMRLSAASSLAAVDALDASVAVDLTGAAAVLKDADAIVSAILAASRGGIALRPRDFDTFAQPATEKLVERAIRIGERWRSSGDAPTEDDRSALVRRLQRALL